MVTERPKSADEVSRSNQEFWDYVCGSDLAQIVGVDGRSEADLARFDDAYFATYPYLDAYLPVDDLAGRRILEVGLGFGSVGERLARSASSYCGVDIAAEPVALMQQRLRYHGLDGQAVRASVLDLPFRTDGFDAVYAIGSLHHTGDLARSVEEVARVLGPGGTAIVMLYNRWSWRQMSPLRIGKYLATSRRHGGIGAAMRATYDRDATGAGAPHIDFTTRREVRELFADFRSVRIDVRNMGTSPFGHRLGRFPRRRLVDSPVERLVGQDLYVVAER